MSAPLPRTLEPEVMASPEEALVYDEMDHSAANHAFVDDLLARCSGTGAWLDLGTGTAQMPLELCRRTKFQGRITAIDLSESMLDLARCHIEAASLSDRIRLDRVDAKSLPWPDSSFDGVCSNSIVHHLPDPEPALREAVRVVRPGGFIFVRDLVRPQAMVELEALVARYMHQESDEGQRLFRESLRAALNLEEIRQLVERIGFSADSVYASSDRHWTWCDQKGAEESPHLRAAEE
ncbi:MAG: class I SAM-dependent methyltransferase [Planctomycetota bacterium]